MQDVCDQDTIEISPELRNVFSQHCDRVYMLSWFAGIIRTYVNRDIIKRKIRERYIQGMEQHKADYPFSAKAADKFKKGAIEFLNDFDALSFSDIDILRQLEPKETIRRIITTINGKQIRFMEV